MNPHCFSQHVSNSRLETTTETYAITPEDCCIFRFSSHRLGCLWCSRLRGEALRALSGNLSDGDSLSYVHQRRSAKFVVRWLDWSFRQDRHRESLCSAASRHYYIQRISLCIGSVGHQEVGHDNPVRGNTSADRMDLGSSTGVNTTVY